MPEPKRDRIDQDDVIRELRTLATKLDRPVVRLDLPRPLHWAVLRWFGSITKARDAAELAGPERNTRWDRDRVLSEMRRLSRAGMIITRRNLQSASRHDLIGAISAHVGTLVRARRLARVPGPTYQDRKRQKWDEDRVIQEIRNCKRGGESLASSKAPSALVRAAIYYFESWRSAIEASGLDYDKVRLIREPYTEEELLERLRVLAKRRPRMTAGAVAHLPWREALVKHFGSVEIAVRRAGIERWPLRLRKTALSRTKVIAALRARRLAGKSTYMRAVMQDDQLLFHSVLVHFGDWKHAIAAAKLRSDSPRKNTWTRESRIAAIVDRHRRGLSLKRSDMLRADSRLLHSAAAYFGGWAAALRAAGVRVPWTQIRWTPNRVITGLRRAAAGRKRVSVAEAGTKLVNACQRHFGSFTAACRAAGLSTDHGVAIAARFNGTR